MDDPNEPPVEFTDEFWELLHQDIRDAVCLQIPHPHRGVCGRVAEAAMRVVRETVDPRVRQMLITAFDSGQTQGVLDSARRLFPGDPRKQTMFAITTPDTDTNPYREE